MKILVMSDTHGSLKYARRVLADFEKQVDGFIHLGDHLRDGEDLRRMFPALKYWAVKGNCDYEQGRLFTVASLDGHRIYICHGHREDVRYDRLRLVYCAKEHNCDCALYGHTHIGDIDFYGGVKIFNPGSLSLPRDGLIKTFGILNTDKNEINAEIYGIDGDKYILGRKG